MNENKQTPAASYREAGVNLDETDAFVANLPAHMAPTRSPDVLSDERAFSGLFRLNLTGIEDPVLVTTTDGVGTKLLIAEALDRHDSIGIDLVAMCANDLITCGARPLVFLDYMAFGAFDRQRADSLLEGISAGCIQASMSLVGGETAVMPGFYPQGRYEIVGFAAGIVDGARRINATGLQAGDRVLALPSSGLHSNGYSLVRHVLLGEGGITLDQVPAGQTQSWGEILLTPTRIYVEPIMKLLSTLRPKACAHITGGGIVDNLARILPKEGHLGIELFRNLWSVPWIFGALAERGRIPDNEMLRTFNMGLGFALIADPDTAREIHSINGEFVDVGHVHDQRGGVHVS